MLTVVFGSGGIPLGGLNLNRAALTEPLWVPILAAFLLGPGLTGAFQANHEHR